MKSLRRTEATAALPSFAGQTVLRHLPPARRGALGIGGLAEIGAIVLLIAILFWLLWRVGLVRDAAVLMDERVTSAPSNAAAEPPIYGFAVAHTAEIALLHRYESGVERRSLHTGERLVSDRLPAVVSLSAVALSTDGRRLGFGLADGSIIFRFQDRSGSREVITTAHERPVCALQFSPDGRLAASSSDDGAVRIWEVPTGQVRHTLQLEGCVDEVCTHITFSRDGRLLAAASRSGPLACWRTGDGQPINSFSIHGGLRGLAFSPDGGSLVVPNTIRRDISRIDLRSGREIWTRPHPETGATYTSVATTPDGQWVAAGDSFGWLYLLDAATGDVVRTFEAHDANISGLQYSPDGTVLYSASHDGRIGIWNVRELAGEPRCSDAFFPGGLPVQRSSRETPGNSKTKSGPYAVEGV